MDCFSNGCDQCVGGNTIFKRNFQYFCENCTDIFGSACLFCQDFNGCGQCAGGYQLVQDSISGLRYCEDPYNPASVDCGPTGEVGEDWPDGEDPSCTTPYPTSTTYSPTNGPAERPSPAPTDAPTGMPADFPTNKPSQIPTQPPHFNLSDATNIQTPFPTNISSLLSSTFPIHGPTIFPTTLSTDDPSSIPTEIPSHVNYKTTNIANYSDNVTSYPFTSSTSKNIDSLYSSSCSTTVNNTHTTSRDKDNSKQAGLSESGLLIAIGMICATLFCIFLVIIFLAWKSKMAEKNRKHELELERIRAEKKKSQSDMYNAADLSKVQNFQQATKHDTGEVDTTATSLDMNVNDDDSEGEELYMDYGDENGVPISGTSGDEIIYQEKSLNDDDDIAEQITNEGDNKRVGMNQQSGINRVQTKLVFILTILIVDCL